MSQSELFEQMFNLPKTVYSESKQYAMEELANAKSLISNSNLSRRDRIKLRLQAKLAEKKIEKEENNYLRRRA